MIKKVFTSIWFLGLIIAVPVIVFFPPVFDKYVAELISKEPTKAIINYIYFEDLDGDGIKEKITSHQNSANKLSFQLYSKNGSVKNEQYFNYNYFIRPNSLHFGDINNDNHLEIYGFTINIDSLFLNWFEPKTDYKTQKNKFITRINTFDEGKTDISILNFEVVDFENDGINEILISIEAGYSIHPRVLIIYKPSEDKIIRSADRGINSYTPFLHDLNNDGISEIVTSSAASDNLFRATGVPNIDDRPWLQVFNSDLEYFFKPVSFSAGLSNTTETFVTKDGKNDLIVFNCNKSRDVKEIICLYKFDKNGIIQDSTYLSEYGKDFVFKVFQMNSGFLFFTGDEVLWINNNLKIIKHQNIDPSTTIVAIDTMPKSNQIYFIALTQQQNRLNIFTEDFTEEIALQFESEKILSVKTNASEGSDSFLVRTDNNEYYYKFKKNRNYFLQYPVYFLIYLLSVFFIWFIQMIREKQLREKFELKNKVHDLQLKTLKNQLDPHFIFNTFNTIASVVKQGRSEEAYNIMVRFSKMVRTNLDNSNEIYTTLKGELDFVEDYLFIQNFRFKDLFEYKIEVEKDLNLNIPIPKLLLQIHVENALIHGIRPGEKIGFILIRITRKNSVMIIEINDNGIGREKSKLLKTGGSGIGLKAIQQIIELNNQNSKNKLTQKIIDIFDSDGSSVGTKIEISITNI